MSLINKKITLIVSEFAIRLILLICFLYLEDIKPFERIIQPEEWWLYKNPMVKNQAFSAFHLYMIATLTPLTIILIFSGILYKASHDFFPALSCSSLIIVLNGCVTNCIKLGVGRPRPDFFYRCYPDGNQPLQQPPLYSLECTGDMDIIMEGRKSFPSGHSSFSFASLGFCAVYMCGKLQCFNSVGRGKSWRLLISLSPLLVSTMIAISRTCDYRHHWQDVVTGSLLGFSINYLIYRQYYPSLSSIQSYLPYSNQNEEDDTKLRKVVSGNALSTNNGVGVKLL